MALRAGRVGVKPDQVNAQGEIIGSGGGGSKSYKLSLDLLINLTTFSAGDETISGKFSDYDLILVESGGTYSSKLLLGGNVYATKDLKAGVGLGTTNEAAYCWYEYKNDTTITFVGNLYPLPAAFTIYGIRLEEEES